MDATEFNSPFEGTPWNSDEEIYDFVSHKRNQIGHDWDEIHSFLTAEGLDGDYAHAIITNFQKQAVENQARTNRKWIAGGLAYLWAIVAVLFIKPISYTMSPEYGRYIFIGIIGVGLALINQYRKGELNHSEKFTQISEDTTQETGHINKLGDRPTSQTTNEIVKEEECIIDNSYGANWDLAGGNSNLIIEEDDE